MKTNIVSLFPGQKASLNCLPAERHSMRRACIPAVRLIKLFMAMFLLLIAGACWNSANACSMGQTNNTNGNGVYDAGDLSNWQSATTCNGINDFLAYIEGRKLCNSVAGSDTNGVIQLIVFTPLK